MKLFLIRIKICWLIITQKHKHWVLLPLKEDDMISVLTDEDFEIDATYHKMQPYVLNKMLKMYSEQLSDVDMILQKAKFQHDAAEFNKKKKDVPNG